MKQVINQKETNVVSLAEVSEHKYYGFKSENGDVGFVARRSYRVGDFTLFCFSSLTRGNTINSWDNINLSVVLRGALGCQHAHFEIFEFDTYQEFLQWAVDNQK